MASLLGNLIYSGLATLLTTQATVGCINSVPNLYSINSGHASAAPPDSALFQRTFSGSHAALGAGIGTGMSCTIAPLLVTRTSNVTVWFNSNTTAMPGEITVAYWHSRIR